MPFTQGGNLDALGLVVDLDRLQREGREGAGEQLEGER
jgi:hypothetical protein